MPSWLRTYPFMRTSFGLLLILGIAQAAALACDAKPPRPNVLFILSDDQSYGTMGCTGSPFMKTPNLDRLARDGALFRNMITATSVCAPSRATFMTGTYSWVNGVHRNLSPWDPGNIILAQLMQEAGYDTAHIGKWHCGGLTEPQPGYDYWFAPIGQGLYEDPVVNLNGQTKFFDGHYLTTLSTDETIRFIERDHGGKPFMIWYATKALHAPRVPERRYMKRFSDLGVLKGLYLAALPSASGASERILRKDPARRKTKICASARLALP